MRRSRLREKKKEKAITLLLSIILTILVATISFIFIQLLQFNLSISLLMDFVLGNITLTVMNIFVLWIAQWPFILLLGNTIRSSFVFLFFMILFGIGNYQKMLYRPEPIYPSDVIMLKDINFLFFSVERIVQISIIFVIITFLVSLFFLSKSTYVKKANIINKGYIRVISFIVSLVLFIPLILFNKTDYIVKTSFEKFAEVQWISFNQVKNYEKNGVVAGFLYNLGGQAINEPPEYSRKKMQELANKYKNEAKEINTTRKGSLDDVNLVYIMNESLSDPNSFEGLSVTPDPIVNHKQVSKVSWSGQSLAQGFGGGTANAEFEALTGISFEPLLPNISSAYTQLTSTMNRVPSVISYLNNEANDEYTKTAIHPFQSSMYRRTGVYNEMGFDNLIFEEDMDFDDKLESSLYISDWSAYQQVLQEITKTKTKDFVHLVTMQGHGPYHVGYFGNLQKFVVEGKVSQMDMLNYVSSLQYTDEALLSYVSEVNKSDEKIITVYWGDHLPAAYSYDVTKQNKDVAKYQTPLIIHSNFSSEHEDLGTISPMFFMNKVLEKVDGKVTPYYALLEKISEKLPAFEKGFYLDSNYQDLGNNRKDIKDQEALELLNDYDLIIYDIFHGGDYAKDMDFYTNKP
ncbi:LTA synthase family protein [Carnobacterium sp. ISL-102]|uniref:LTA synthase family protein n=1 Tax=Carnobacterium sp. ISL-102 TaxID=2819142 RepID=UPI001BE7E129|nr:LTA synthase family protein [Carnobacterium sp. ISL-102]MBT2731096.1 sulfatase-like hydrolase/transferase [Carnobacterium sp. ISL-102]